MPCNKYCTCIFFMPASSKQCKQRKPVTCAYTLQTLAMSAVTELHSLVLPLQPKCYEGTPILCRALIIFISIGCGLVPPAKLASRFQWVKVARAGQRVNVSSRTDAHCVWASPSLGPPIVCTPPLSSPLPPPPPNTHTT